MPDSKAKYAELLRDILENGTSYVSIKNDKTEKNIGFINMLFMTTFRQLTFIKGEVLPQFLKKKIPHKQNILEYILYLATTEILFMNTAEYAVINSYVEAAKSKTDKFGANFINAVLRNILRQKDTLIQRRKTKYFNKNFLKILKQDYTPQEISEMEEFAVIEPALDLTLKNHSVLKDYMGIFLPTGSYRLPANSKVVDIPGFTEGLWWVQDAASALAVNQLSNLNGKKVLDLCAAPGGKTAQLLNAGAIVTAVDVSEKRLTMLKENITRLNLNTNLTVICADALDFSPTDTYDIVLVDAPCSATGTFRRHPEIIHTKTLNDVKKQAALQRQLLEHASSLIKPGGLLVYATCSLSKEEGEKQIKTFALKHSNFSIKPITSPETKEMQTKEGFLRVLPQHMKQYDGIDGFFVAYLQRNN